MLDGLTLLTRQGHYKYRSLPDILWKLKDKAGVEFLPHGSGSEVLVTAVDGRLITAYLQEIVTLTPLVVPYVLTGSVHCDVSGEVPARGRHPRLRHPDPDPLVHGVLAEMNDNKLPTIRPATIDDVTPPSLYDGLTAQQRLRLKLAELQAKANRIDRLNAAQWQREQDRRAALEEEARQRRRRGR